MLQPLATPEACALHLILQRVIVDAIGRNASNTEALAAEAAKAFRAGLNAFTAPTEAVVGLLPVSCQTGSETKGATRRVRI